MISHAHRFIFVHAGRTGGSTIERMAGIPLTDDPRTQWLGNTDFADKHARLQHYYSAYPEQFRSYFKFTIVRNPFDRLHSAWHWRTRVVQDLCGMPLREFIDTRPAGYSFVERFAVEGMSITESVGLFDHIARFEKLAEEYNFLIARIGLPPGPVPHTNRTAAGDYRDAYDQQTVDLVRRKFGRDLELFRYDFAAS
ncbi:MAG: sulfotransferase family protein [Phycisphaerales bacterium]|nr:sulfotransferase family protein [Phycisphaerales bacterium]